MEGNKEKNALLTLIDDPDEEVFGLVSQKIVDYGKLIIPDLEHLWETTHEESIQGRIETLIHRLHYRDLIEDFRQWNLSGHHDLMVGALLTGKFLYPELVSAPVIKEIEKIRRNLWLELNNYLTSLEQINIVTSIIYNFFGLKGNEVNYDETNEFLLHKTLETKRGNQLSNTILYLLLTELADIPVRAIEIPNQFIVAYFKPGYSEENLPNPAEKIDFFINPTNGQIFTHDDVTSYLKRISVSPSPSFFVPQTNKAVIIKLLEEFSKCFNDQQSQSKKIELLDLIHLLES